MCSTQTDEGDSKWNLFVGVSMCMLTSVLLNGNNNREISGSLTSTTIRAPNEKRERWKTFSCKRSFNNFHICSSVTFFVCSLLLPFSYQQRFTSGLLLLVFHMLFYIQHKSKAVELDYVRSNLFRKFYEGGAHLCKDYFDVFGAFCLRACLSFAGLLTMKNVTKIISLAKQAWNWISDWSKDPPENPQQLFPL